MAKQTRFAWPSLPTATTKEQLIARLNAMLPLVQQSIDQQAEAAARALAGQNRYTNVRGWIVEYDATSATITALASVPALPGDDPCRDPADDAVLEVNLKSLLRSTLVSGPAVGVWSPNLTQWVVTRPLEGEGDAIIEVGSRLAGGAAEGDSDIVYVREQGVEINLQSAVRVIARVHQGDSTADTLAVDITISGEGADAPTAGTLVVDSWQGLAGAAPADTSGALPFTVRHLIPKPDFGAPDGRVVWRGFATDVPDALTDGDAQDVAPKQRDTVQLVPKVEMLWQTATQIAFVGSIEAPPAGVGPVTLTPTVTDAVLAGGSGTIGDPWVVNRPAFKAGPGELLVTATATGAVAGSIPVAIPPQERDTVAVRIIAVRGGPVSGNNYGAFVLTVTAIDPLGEVAPAIDDPVELDVDHLVHLTNTVDGATRTRTFEVHPLTEGGGTGELTFRGWHAERADGTVAFPVPAWRYPGGGYFELTDISIASATSLYLAWIGHATTAFVTYPPAMPLGTKWRVSTSVQVNGGTSGSGNYAIVSGRRTFTRTSISPANYETWEHDVGCRIAASDPGGGAYSLENMTVIVSAMFDGQVIQSWPLIISVWAAPPLV